MENFHNLFLSLVLENGAEETESTKFVVAFVFLDVKTLCLCLSSKPFVVNERVDVFGCLFGDIRDKDVAQTTCQKIVRYHCKILLQLQYSQVLVAFFVFTNEKGGDADGRKWLHIVFDNSITISMLL